MLRSVMNETSPEPNKPAAPHTEHPVIDQCADKVKNVADRVKGWAGPAVSLVSYGLIVGFALSGLAIMALSALIWVFFNTSLFSGFGLLTGGIFLSAATALFLGRLTKTGDAIYRKHEHAGA